MQATPSPQPLGDKTRPWPAFVAAFCLLLFLPSCYSVRVTSRHAVPEPNPANLVNGFYRQMQVHTLDTVITQKILDSEFTLNLPCPGGGLYSVEYRATLGGVLLNAITFGRRKTVRIKYVCSKEENR